MESNATFERQQIANDYQAPVHDGFFHDSIKVKVDQETADGVLDVFNNLFDLPVPNKHEFLHATEGVLVFSNILGIVLRVEVKEDEFTRFTRENDNPFILQPLASLPLENCIIEICPGTHIANDDDSDDEEELYITLQQMGVNPLDLKPDNFGFLPCPDSKEPSNFPVVIDRLAVERVTEGALSIKQALAERNLTEDPQKALYADLKSAFDKALSAPTQAEQKQRFRDCWRLCAQKTQERLLVAGWTQVTGDDGLSSKTRTAASISKRYDQRIADNERERERAAEISTRQKESLPTISSHAVMIAFFDLFSSSSARRITAR